MRKKYKLFDKRRILYTLLFLLGINNIGWGQAILPVSRTTWNGSTPTGWTDSGTADRTSGFACSGNNAETFNSTGDRIILFIDSAPDELTFKLKSASMSGSSSLLVEQSTDNLSYTTLGTYTSSNITDCNDIIHTLAPSTRYIRWTYTKGSGNCDIDDVSITKQVISCSGTPTVQASNISLSSITSTSVDVSWSAGTGGDSYILVLREGSPVSFNPTTGTDYSGGTGGGDFSTATSLDADDNKIVYDGSATSLTVTGLSPTTMYYFQVFHYCENSGAKNYLTSINTNNDGSQNATTTAVTYCTAISMDDTFETISGVTIDGTNHTSGASTYSDFTSTTFTLEQGETINFTVDIDNPFSSDILIIWIDWNQNGTLDDSGEEVYNSTAGSGPYNGSFSVPNTASLGSTRMRLRLYDSGSGTSNSTPCGTHTYGEVEDYTINIIAPCTSATLTSFEPTEGSANTRVTITGSGFTGATAVKFDGVDASSYTVVSDTEITATVPTGASTGVITVTNSVNCDEQTTTDFTVLTQSCGIFATDLFISEVYDRVSGSLGYIELYNGTNTSIDLTNYTIPRYGNSTDVTPSHTYTFPVGTTINSGQVLVGKVSSSANVSGVTPDFTFEGSTAGFNGSDRLELHNSSTKIDEVIVQETSPGYTMIRNATVTSPNTTFTVSEWTSSGTESTADLGSHTINSSGGTPPNITTQPSDQTFCPGDNVMLSVSATGANRYQWYRWTSGGTFAEISGATSNTLSFTSDASHIDNQYYCRVGDNNSNWDCYEVSQAMQLSISCALPLNVLSFEGEDIGQQQARLYWTSQHNSQTISYHLQKSLEGQSFKTIAQIEITNTNVLQNYKIIDPDFRQSAYYRLQEYKENGQVEIGDMIYLKSKEKQLDFSIYPNPLYKTQTLKIKPYLDKDISLKLYHSTGKSIYEETGLLETMNQKLNSKIKNLNSGFYILTIEFDNKIWQEKLIIK